MSGIYWGVTALDIMDNVSKLDKASIVDFIRKCQCPVSGGISPCEGHDPHVLYTLSAVQVEIYILPFELHRFLVHILIDLFRYCVSMTACMRSMSKLWPNM